MFARRSTRPPPPSGQPPPYAFSRYYRYDLRPIVIGSAVLTGLWALLWGINSFQNINPDKSHSLGKVVPFDIVLGALYISVAVIEIFGIYATVKRSLSLVRLYTILTVCALIITMAGEILNLVIHFLFKNTFINECTTAVTGDLVSDDFGSFGTHNVHNLTPDEARDYCTSAFNHDTFSDIVWLLATLIIGLLFTSAAYSYYRQLLDPSSVATRFPRSNNVPLQNFGGRYGQQSYGHNPYPQSAPEPYAPPYDNAKLPEYGYSSAEVNLKGEEKERDAVEDVGTSHKQNP